ncbi:hypothetical protein Dda_1461 [Drechslerella dactyloides]|uniref:NmrA-like domain-containing protein n=1 Tax=Drechslerella dactyloides TaxID=74499 RepID=A0AAD6J1S3_DREDA|nr:hypothetical protein Dda_1461 [Drechslerella dactyloides]
MSSLPVIAVAGGTGTLGKELVSALLDPQLRSKYKDIIILTRDANTPRLAEWIQRGVLVRKYATEDVQSAVEALSGVDVLVNTIASRDDGFKSKLAAAIVSSSSSVKLYFPSEFGVDHYLHDFQHPEWDKKKAHFEAVAQRKNLKICRVFPGLFLEHSVGPWYGLDPKTGKYEFVGTGDNPISYTSIVDLGRAVASAITSIPIADFPENLYFSGDLVSLREITNMLSASGVAPAAEISSLELPAFKAKTIATHGLDPAWYLRFLMAEGKIDNASRNDNELVNPEERFWKWKKMKEHIGTMAEK